MIYYDAPWCTRRIYVPLQRRPVTEPPAGFTDEMEAVIRDVADGLRNATAAEVRIAVLYHRGRTDITTNMVRYVLGQ